jgi:hypothetical protein
MAGYRNGLDKEVPLPGGNKPFDITVIAKPQDYIFRKGHMIGLNIQTEINEWSLPKPYPCQSADCPFIVIETTQGKTQLVLPIVNPPKNPMDLFDMVGHHH